MIAYSIAFILSAVFDFFASSAQSKKACAALIVLSCSPLVLLAGLRSVEVGTDVVVYLQGMYWKSIDGGLEAVLSGNSEPLFAILVWAATKLTGSLNGVMACVEIAILAPFVLASYRMTPRRMGIAMLLYCLIFFLFGLNCMRQSIAISFMLLASSFLIEKREKPFWALMICAILVHNTAILGIVIWPVLKTAQHHFALREGARSDGLFYVLAIGALLLLTMMICFAPDLIKAVAGWRESFQYQVDQLERGNGIVWKGMLLPVAFSLALLFSWRSGKNRAVIVTCLVLLWIGGFFWQFSSVSNQLYRLGMPFLIFVIPGVLSLLDDCKDRTISFLIGMAIASASSLFGFVFYIANGYAGTIPYHSDIVPLLSF